MARKDLCGLQAYEWSPGDQVAAETQAGIKLLDRRKQEEQSRHMALRIRLHDECQAEKDATYLATVRVVMANARKWHRRPSISNQQLLADLFSLDWKQAASLCARLSIDPKGIN